MHTSLLNKSYLHDGFTHVLANHVAIITELEYKVKLLKYQHQSTDKNDSHKRSKFKMHEYKLQLTWNTVDCLWYFSNLNFNIFILYILPPWVWPHGWPKHVGLHYVHNVFQYTYVHFVDTSIIYNRLTQGLCIIQKGLLYIHPPPPIILFPLLRISLYFDNPDNIWWGIQIIKILIM
jgi:hypothetical protein